MAAKLIDRVNDDDVFVSDLRGHARFQNEALRQAGVSLQQELHRDFTTELDVTGEEHRAHAALADFTNDFVVADAGAGPEARGRGRLRYALELGLDWGHILRWAQ